MTTELRLRRIQPGRYVSEDGRFAVLADGIGYVTQSERDGDGICAGIIGDEWAAVYSAEGELLEGRQSGDNLAWFDTKREALSFLRDWARRQGA